MLGGRIDAVNLSTIGLIFLYRNLELFCDACNCCCGHCGVSVEVLIEHALSLFSAHSRFPNRRTEIVIIMIVGVVLDVIVIVVNATITCAVVADGSNSLSVSRCRCFRSRLNVQLLIGSLSSVSHSCCLRDRLNAATTCSDKHRHNHNDDESNNGPLMLSCHS